MPAETPYSLVLRMRSEGASNEAIRAKLLELGLDEPSVKIVLGASGRTVSGNMPAIPPPTRTVEAKMAWAPPPPTRTRTIESLRSSFSGPNHNALIGLMLVLGGLGTMGGTYWIGPVTVAPYLLGAFTALAGGVFLFLGLSHD